MLLSKPSAGIVLPCSNASCAVPHICLLLSPVSLTALGGTRVQSSYVGIPKCAVAGR